MQQLYIIQTSNAWSCADLFPTGDPMFPCNTETIPQTHMEPVQELKLISTLQMVEWCGLIWFLSLASLFKHLRMQSAEGRGHFLITQPVSGTAERAKGKRKEKKNIAPWECPFLGFTAGVYWSGMLGYKANHSHNHSWMINTLDTDIFNNLDTFLDRYKWTVWETSERNSLTFS